MTAPAKHRDYGHEAQQAAEAHLDALGEALDLEESGQAATWPDSAGPWCGCDTCVIRETIWAAWPLAQASARAHLADPGDS